MVPVKVMISEVHIKEFNSVKSANKAIISSRFMHKLMGNNKLSSVIIRSNKRKSYDVRQSLKTDLYG